MIDHLITPKRPKVSPTGSAPEDYDDFHLPDGMETDHELTGRFKSAAKSLGLSQTQAQSLVDMYAEHAGQLKQRFDQAQDAKIADWQKQARADREIGGAKFEQSLALAKKAVDRFGGDPLAHALVETGAASHPDVLRCFCRIGKGMSEDGFVAPGAKRTRKSYGETFYPDLNP